jgi:hypothetical protein
MMGPVATAHNPLGDIGRVIIIIMIIRLVIIINMLIMPIK